MNTKLWLAAGTVLALLASPATARELHWESLEVRAHLDGDGLLHIEERQAMVFTGDWNGGERVFRLLSGQKVELESLTRIDRQGKAVELVPGDLSEIDHYDWADGSTLRWRSRLPSDPPFDATPIVYVLDYALSGALRRLEGKTFRIEPDFVFPNRPGVIERFSLTFTADPVWDPVRLEPPSSEALEAGPEMGAEGGLLLARLERTDLRPGRSVVVDADLIYTGPGWPAAVPRAAPLALLVLLGLGALGAAIYFFADLFRHEGEAGRFDPTPPASLDPTSLQESLFSFTPEEAGALWDRRVGPPEVAAVLARLVAEDKLESDILPKKRFFGSPVLRLRRLVSPAELQGYDRKLVAKLFFDDRWETDTAAIREHYRSEGFDPAKVIRPALEARLETTLGRRLGFTGRRSSSHSGRTGLLALAAIVTGVVAGFLRPEVQWVLTALVGIPSILFLLVGLTFAARWKQRVDWKLGPAQGFLLPAVLSFLAAFAALAIGRWAAPVPPSLLGETALLLIPVFLASAVAGAARSDEPKAVYRLRQRLAALRRRFQEELDRPRPALEDAWFPYLLAFGLQGEVDRWFKAFGGASSSGALATTSVGSSGASASTGRGWSGGGGAFGGGGATSTWAVAATGLASGVSPPSSSGGSGGGGGGGGSSGGGGGGGW